MEKLLRFLGTCGCTGAVLGIVLVLHRGEPVQERKIPIGVEDRQVKPETPGTPRFVIAPYLQFPTRTSITIMWETGIWQP